MLRHFVRSSRAWSPAFLSHVKPKPWVGRALICTGGVTGLGYYMKNEHTIYADANNSEETLQPPTLPPTRSVELLLDQNSMGLIPPEGCGVRRVETVVISSNSPGEDFVTLGVSNNYTMLAIFDGHNGPHTSGLLSDVLLNRVLDAFENIFETAPDDDHSEEHQELGSPSAPKLPSDQAVEDAIKRAFMELDDEIVNKSAEEVLSSPLGSDTIRTLAAAHAGSCALLSCYEAETRKLRVALTGDSRAILGRRKTDASGKDFYEVHVLSLDQNGNNPAEMARLSAMHPGETISKGDRVLGWGMSRAFGDGSTKWSLDTQEQLQKKYLGDRPYANVKTPPYFTAEPVITTTQVEKGDFLIMASDGLWECLSNEEAVGLVGLWLQKNKINKVPPAIQSGQRPIAGPHAKVVERHELPVKLPEDDNTVRYRLWRAKKRFLNVDDNSAVHLARNAFGGANRELTAALLEMRPPRSRRFRDDTSICIAFFD